MQAIKGFRNIKTVRNAHTLASHFPFHSNYWRQLFISGHPGGTTHAIQQRRWCSSSQVNAFEVKNHDALQQREILLLSSTDIKLSTFAWRHSVYSFILSCPFVLLLAVMHSPFLAESPFTIKATFNSVAFCVASRWAAHYKLKFNINLIITPVS